MSDPNLKANPSTEEEAIAAGPPNPVSEMRVILFGVLAAVVLISLSFNVFMYKANQRIQEELKNANAQIDAIEKNPVLQQNRAVMGNLLQELAAQANAHPEVHQILAGYGVAIQNAAAPATDQQATSAPQTPAKN